MSAEGGAQEWQTCSPCERCGGGARLMRCVAQHAAHPAKQPARVRRRGSMAGPVGHQGDASSEATQVRCAGEYKAGRCSDVHIVRC
jgi:hypothetical protein